MASVMAATTRGRASRTDGAMRRRGARGCIAVVLCLAVFLPTMTPSVGAQSREVQRLAEVKDRLAEVRRAIEAAERRNEQDAAALSAAEQQLKVVADAVGDAEQAVKRQRAAVSAARDRMGELLAAERDQREILAERAADMYKRGTGVPELVLLTSKDNVTERAAHLQGVTHVQTAALEELSISRRSLEAQRKVLRAEEASLQNVLAQRREVFAEAEALRDTRALAAAASRNSLNALEAQEQILLADQEGLEALTRRAMGMRASRGSQRAQPPGGRAADPDGWVWPTSGPVTSEFGPRWGRMHEGIDIGAPTGAPIYAGSGGVVAYAGWRGGYGNLTLINHGDGIISAYAHQSRIGVSVGQQVRTGEVVGSVGATGNVTGPHLHYEVRILGAPRNPRRYLP